MMLSMEAAEYLEALKNKDYKKADEIRAAWKEAENRDIERLKGLVSGEYMDMFYELEGRFDRYISGTRTATGNRIDFQYAWHNTGIVREHRGKKLDVIIRMTKGGFEPYIWYCHDYNPYDQEDISFGVMQPDQLREFISGK